MFQLIIDNGQLIITLTQTLMLTKFSNQKLET